MRAMFADPKTAFVFKRIFGTEAHKPFLLHLLNVLLELDDERRIVDLKHQTPEQHVPVEGLKLSLVDVKCTDETGRHYLVQMQVLTVEGFDKPIVDNAVKACVTQLRAGDDYPQMCDVVGVTICDFELWPEPPAPESPPVRPVPPVAMLSRWRTQEQHGGASGLPRVQYVFVELPKYRAGARPESLVDRWAYFFREVKNLEMIPEVLHGAPFREALEVARIANFTYAEQERYERAKMSEQDARGALSLAWRQGYEEGLEEGLEEVRVARREAGLRRAIRT